jgi:hypothetical protein
MNQITIQPTSSPLLPPTDPAAIPPDLWPKYATINAHTGRGRDWVAVADLSEMYGVPLDPPEYWQIYRLKPRGHETIHLYADTFYRVRLAGQHFGLYIDSSGGINYLTKKAFDRELDRRYRDGAKDVNLECGGDWAGDPFSNCIPEANLGESRFWLDPQ